LEFKNFKKVLNLKDFDLCVYYLKLINNIEIE